MWSSTRSITALSLVLAGLFLFSVFALAQTNDRPEPATSSNGPKPGYVLAANDLLEIKVFQEDDLQTRVRISREGTITFPLIGVVSVGGRTPQDAARAISERLAKGYLINPQVSVNVLEFTKARLTVLGQVQKPGSYDFPDRERLTLLEAIGMAGGYTRGANPSKVLIKRIVRGKETISQVNAREMAGSASTAAVEVLPGDIVTVSESIF